MVGRAGRSKGCVTCRRRRVKCDERKPTCHNCQRLGLECGGYNDHTFINQSVPVGRYKSASASPRRRFSHASSLSPPPEKNDPWFNVINPATEKSLTLVKPLTLPREWTIEMFAVRTLFHGPYRENGLWLPFAISQTGQDILASECFSALAQVAFGRAHEEQEIERDGVRTYGRVLKSLNSKLRDPEKACSRDTIASVAILGVYECLSNDATAGWIQHQLGLGNLLRMRGPYAHISPVDRQLFENIRFQLIVCAITMRKRSFLEDTVWKTLPWSKADFEASEPAPRSPLQHLLDFTADVPGLLERVDDLRQGFDQRNREERCDTLFKQTVETLNEMREWFDEWMATKPDMVRRRSSDVERCDLETLLLPLPPTHAGTELEFPSLLISNVFVIYHSTLILFYSIMHALLTLYPTLASASTSDLDTAKIRISLDASIDAIISSVPYHIAPPVPPDSSNGRRPHSPSVGAYFMIAPLRISRFPARGERRKWLNTVLKQIAETTRIQDAGDSAFGTVVGWRIAENEPWIDREVWEVP